MPSQTQSTLLSSPWSYCLYIDQWQFHHLPHSYCNQGSKLLPNAYSTYNKQISMAELHNIWHNWLGGTLKAQSILAPRQAPHHIQIRIWPICHYVTTPQNGETQTISALGAVRSMKISIMCFSVHRLQAQANQHGHSSYPLSRRYPHAH